MVWKNDKRIPRVSPGRRESSEFVRTRPSAVAILRNPCFSDRCARSFKSPTVESSGSNRVAPEPLGNDTVTWSMAVFFGGKQNNLLVGGLNPSEKKIVSWDDDIPNWMEK